MAKNKNPKILEITLLEDCLGRFKQIGNRQPLPTQHFFKEAQEIIRDAVRAAYDTGLADAKSGKTSFPMSDFTK